MFCTTVLPKTKISFVLSSCYERLDSFYQDVFCVSAPLVIADVASNVPNRAEEPVADAIPVNSPGPSSLRRVREQLLRLFRPPNQESAPASASSGATTTSSALSTTKLTNKQPRKKRKKRPSKQRRRKLLNVDRSVLRDRSKSLHDLVTTDPSGQDSVDAVPSVPGHNYAKVRT